jgi:o-succinylbenzoate synthase
VTLPRLRLTEYRFEPKDAPRSARQEWPERAGLLLQLRADDGRVGQGEAAPLPGFSSDTLGECHAALSVLTPEWLADLARLELRPALSRVDECFGSGPPAARAALECALLDLFGQERARPIWALLRDLIGDASVAPSELPVAALISGDIAEWPARARAAYARGVRTLKIKIGRPGVFASELSALCALRAELGPEVALRLDANRGFTPAEVEARLDALGAVAPEYVEEPTSDWSRLRRSAVPLALDESLVDPRVLADAGARRKDLQLVACVLKPTLLGGAARTLELLRCARVLGLDAVLSHTFEGPVGFCLAAAFAFAAGTPERAVGLDSHSVVAAWTRVPLPLAGARLVRPEAPGLGLPEIGIPRP